MSIEFKKFPLLSRSSQQALLLISRLLNSLMGEGFRLQTRMIENRLESCMTIIARR
jgi:hypothetical protein